MKSRAEVLGRLALLLVMAQAMLVLLSWLLNAAWQELPVRSLLSGEGIRWMFGSFVPNLLSPLLVWLLLLCVAFGTLRSVLSKEATSPVRRRTALRLVAFELSVFLVVISLLVAVPHAILLSSTGNMFPSSFSASIIPLMSLVVIVCSLTYGWATRTVRTLAEAYKLLTVGFGWFAWLFPLYVLAVQFLCAVSFVFDF